jgi:hypothetical protein
VRYSTRHITRLLGDFRSKIYTMIPSPSHLSPFRRVRLIQKHPVFSTVNPTFAAFSRILFQMRQNCVAPVRHTKAAIASCPRSESCPSARRPGWQPRPAHRPRRGLAARPRRRPYRPPFRAPALRLCHPHGPSLRGARRVHRRAFTQTISIAL